MKGNRWFGGEDNRIICYLRVILRQWFSVGGQGWRDDYLPQGTLGYVWKHFCFSQLGSVTAPSGRRPGMQLKPYGTHGIGQAPPTTKNYLALNSSSAEDEKLCYGTRMQPWQLRPISTEKRIRFLSTSTEHVYVLEVFENRLALQDGKGAQIRPCFLNS